MAKFYVQSGNFKTTISAGDAEKAALWVIHRVMVQVLPFHSGEPVDSTMQSGLLQSDGLMVLGESVWVSEVGFDSEDRVELDTFELQIHWHQLTVALARLEKMVLRTESTKQVDLNKSVQSSHYDEALCELVG